MNWNDNLSKEGRFLLPEDEIEFSEAKDE